jgi:hypothetical protein
MWAASLSGFSLFTPFFPFFFSAVDACDSRPAATKALA